MRHRTSNYARVMLTSYGKSYGDWMDTAINIGRAVKGLTAKDETDSGVADEDPKNGLKYLAFGLGTLVVGFGVYAFIQSRKARGNS